MASLFVSSQRDGHPHIVLLQSGCFHNSYQLERREYNGG